MARQYVRHGHHVGGKASPTFNSWAHMMGRCYVTADAKYPRYGARGVRVCERWHHFPNFLEDMGVKPVDCTLDRIDNDGHYEPSNCRWATATQQSRNRSITRTLTLHGITKPAGEWAEETGIPYKTLMARLNDHKWPVEKALTTPVLRRI